MLPLDSRQARIARRLLDEPSPASVEVLASDLGLTPRVVRYNLASVEAVLDAGGLRLIRRRGLGVWVERDDGARQAVRSGLDAAPGPSVVDPGDRRARVIVALLDAAPDARTNSRAASAADLAARATAAIGDGTAAQARRRFA